MCADLPRIRLRQQGAHTLLQLGAGDTGRIVLEDPGELEHLLAERTVPGRFAVRPAAPLQERTLPFETRLQFPHEPALADPRRTEDRDEVHPPIRADLVPYRPEELQLSTPSDQRRERRPIVFRPHAEDEPDRDGSELPLDVHRFEGFPVERPHGCAVRALADHDASDRRFVLEPRGRVQHVTGRDRPRRAPTSAFEVDDGLARVDRDPDRQLERRILVVQRVDRAGHLPRGLHRPRRVVLPRRRRAEQARRLRHR